jgi:hypothetical protein
VRCRQKAASTIRNLSDQVYIRGLAMYNRTTSRQSIQYERAILQGNRGAWPWCRVRRPLKREAGRVAALGRRAKEERNGQGVMIQSCCCQLLPLPPGGTRWADRRRQCKRGPGILGILCKNEYGAQGQGGLSWCAEKRARGRWCYSVCNTLELWACRAAANRLYKGWGWGCAGTACGVGQVIGGTGDALGCKVQDASPLGGTASSTKCRVVG